MSVVEILVQFTVCCLLLEHSNQRDVVNLTMCCKMFLGTRKKLLCDKFTLILRKKEDYENCISMGARRVCLRGKEWINDYAFDFSKKEKNLLLFRCPHFDRPLKSFGSLLHFDCHDFDQPVASFDNLRYFRSFFFNQSVKSFGKLVNFVSYRFNQPVESFSNLKVFKAANFRQNIKSFNSLVHFETMFFDQPVSSFDSLQYFTSRCFNQKLDSFGALKVFNCNIFNREMIERWQWHNSNSQTESKISFTDDY